MFKNLEFHVINTVRNAAGFPGDQMVGLPTLVQNPPTANDRQPNRLGQTEKYHLGCRLQKKRGKKTRP